MEPSLPLAPKKFKAALGVESAKFLPCKPAFITRGRSRGRFAVGVRYEREAQEWLSLYALGRPEMEHRNGPWIEFQERRGRRWCQPDALLINAKEKRVVLLEVKYQHTSDAWYQLKQLYLPVLRVAMRGYSFSLVEMVHWYDPLTLWPERPLNVPDLDRAWYHGETVATLIFNRRRERRFHSAGHSNSKGVSETSRPIWPAEGAE